MENKSLNETLKQMRKFADQCDDGAVASEVLSYNVYRFMKVADFVLDNFRRITMEELANGGKVFED